MTDVDKAKQVAMRLKKYFFQEAVLLIVDTVNGEFIYGLVNRPGLIITNWGWKYEA